MTTEEREMERIYIEEVVAYHVNCHEAVTNEELRGSQRCICTTDTTNAFYRLPFSEATLQQQELNYTRVHPQEFITEEHKRPCNALQDLSITYF